MRSASPRLRVRSTIAFRLVKGHSVVLPHRPACAASPFRPFTEVTLAVSPSVRLAARRPARWLSAPGLSRRPPVPGIQKVRPDVTGALKKPPEQVPLGHHGLSANLPRYPPVIVEHRRALYAAHLRNKVKIKSVKMRLITMDVASGK